MEVAVLHKEAGPSALATNATQLAGGDESASFINIPQEPILT